MSKDRAPQPQLEPNRIGPDRKTQTPISTTKGDVPATLLERYLIERDRQGRPERFFRDHRATDPMFRDRGRSLTATQAYPDAVADMLRIARHRGWAAVRVGGDEAFRREAWIQARALGLQVTGHRPRDRDRQAAGEAPMPPRDIETRMRNAALVVRTLLPEPAAQARLVAYAASLANRAMGREPPERRTDRERRH